MPYVKGITNAFVSSSDETLKLFHEGLENRAVSSTQMNSHSSRSHSIFQLKLRQVQHNRASELSSQFFIVDLAGSEQVSKTKAQGSVLNEAKHINKSLMTLSKVIMQLNTKAHHVSYRDSKLTRILQQAFGGNSSTMIVICVNAIKTHLTETKSTLNFGEKARAITNTASRNIRISADEWRLKYENLQEAYKLQQMLVYNLQSELETWRSGNFVEEDERIAFNSDNNFLNETRLIGKIPNLIQNDLDSFGSQESLFNPEIISQNYGSVKKMIQTVAKASSIKIEKKLDSFSDQNLKFTADSITKHFQDKASIAHLPQDSTGQVSLVKTSVSGEKIQNSKEKEELQAENERLKQNLKELKNLANSSTNDTAQEDPLSDASLKKENGVLHKRILMLLRERSAHQKQILDYKKKLAREREVSSKAKLSIAQLEHYLETSSKFNIYDSDQSASIFAKSVMLRPSEGMDGNPLD
ncbi:MAG: Kinesin-1 heavy chain [Paramarteilia canceri]